MFEIFFLICLALVWIAFASVQDWRTREVANWLSFSLVIFAIGFRFFYCLFSESSFGFLYQGLIGLGIFFVIGNLFYYGRFFAGGDAKLMMALGAILPLSESFFINLKIFILFLFLFFFIGAFYGLIWSFVLTARNFKRFKNEFAILFNKNKKLFLAVLFLGLVLMGAGFVEIFLFYFGVLIFLLPYLYIYAKAVDESCMIKSVSVCDLREGDWLYKNLNVGRNVLKSKWEGLSKNEIKLIQKKYKKIQIRYGIPFVPVFLISFLILILIYFSNLFVLWNSFWQTNIFFFNFFSFWFFDCFWFLFFF